MTFFCDQFRIPLPYTPAEIKEQFTNDLGQPLDVFAETVGKLTYSDDPTIPGKLVDQCWHRFRRRPIGDYDYQFWLECLNDRLGEIWPAYSKTLALLTSPALASSAVSKETITETTSRERSADTIQDLTTINNLTTEQENIESHNDHQVVDETVVVEDEDKPDTPPVGTTKYLSKRSTTSRNGTTDTNGGITNTGTIVNTGTVDNEGTITNSENESTNRNYVRTVEDGLASETAIRVYEQTQKAFSIFLDALEPLFMNRW